MGLSSSGNKDLTVGVRSFAHLFVLLPRCMSTKIGTGDRIVFDRSILVPWVNPRAKDKEEDRIRYTKQYI